MARTHYILPMSQMAHPKPNPRTNNPFHANGLTSGNPKTSKQKVSPNLRLKIHMCSRIPLQVELRPTVRYSRLFETAGCCRLIQIVHPSRLRHTQCARAFRSARAALRLHHFRGHDDDAIPVAEKQCSGE
jgi:hypothetical protein